MDFFGLNNDCISLIFGKLDFDSIVEMRKTCNFLKSFPQTIDEKTVLECGTCVSVQEKQEIRCRHESCCDLVLERLRSGKTKNVWFEEYLDHEDFCYEYMYLFLKANPNSLSIGYVRDLFQWALYSSRIDVVMNTYQKVFDKLFDFYNESFAKLMNGDINQLIKIQNFTREDRYYKRALINFAIYYDIKFFQDKINIDHYLPWGEDEEYQDFDIVSNEFLQQIYIGPYEPIGF